MQNRSKYQKILLLMGSICSSFIFGQTSVLDSLKFVLDHAKNDTTRCIILTKMIEAENSSNIWVKYNDEIKKIADKNLPLYKAPARLFYFFSKYHASVLNNVGFIAEEKGEISKAMECYVQSLKIQEAIGDKNGAASNLNNLGVIYLTQNDIPKALEYLLKSLKMREEINDKYGIGNSLNNIGSIYNDQKNFPKAIEYYSRSLKIRQEMGDTKRTAFSLNNLGGSLCAVDSFEQGFNYLNQALVIFKKLNNTQWLSFTYQKLGLYKFKTGNLNEALENGKKAMFFAKQTGSPETVKRAANILTSVYVKKGNYQLALENRQLYVSMRDSLKQAANKKTVIKNQLKYEYEKKAVQDSVKNSEQIVQANIKYEFDIKQQRFYSLGGAIGFGLMIIIAGISFRAFSTKKKANKIISEQKKIAEEQKQIVEEKQKEVLDSIRYAKRIQHALMASEAYIDRQLTRLSPHDRT